MNEKPSRRQVDQLIEPSFSKEEIERVLGIQLKSNDFDRSNGNQSTIRGYWWENNGLPFADLRLPGFDPIFANELNSRIIKDSIVITLELATNKGKINSRTTVTHTLTATSHIVSTVINQSF
ncbi:hypothetical protein KKG52_02380 [Patescibacteria group bacterium]|nr:hypothetical protein [Patescibacteria group bacterium]